MSGNSVDGQRNLERTWKLGEKSGNLKIHCSAVIPRTDRPLKPV